MASAKLSPRQRMINMMYLVLTAMLALNVSAEILKAFAMINKSLEETSQSVGQKNDALYK
ncbi:MAG: gliding motility protein GldM, partial [Bacteroidota bacterium]